MKNYLLALDQGTTSSRAILFDRNQRIVGMAQKEITQSYPKEGWVEQDPMEIYSSQYGVMMEVIAQSNVSVGEIAGIGITNQRETTIVWEKETGQPIYPAIVWQCRRTADRIHRLDESSARYIREATGLVPDAYFSASKISWILDHVEGARERAERGQLLFGTVDTWLIWKLTGGRIHATDYTNASRTMLYHLQHLEWDPVLLETFGVPRGMLPEVRDSCGYYGTVPIANQEIPILGVAGDQQAALFGQACFQPGEAKNTYGTGCFLLMNTGKVPVRSRNGLLTTIAIGLSGSVQYALEGSVFVGGAVIQWLRDELGVLATSRQSECLARQVEDNGGVYFVPAFTGLGAPHWDMHARGCIVGLTRGTTRAHLVRAAQESIAYQSLDLVEAMEKDTGISLPELNVDGGASCDHFLMQFQADILGKKVCRPATRETTALGAAYLAGLRAGLWKTPEEIKAGRKGETIYVPDMKPEQRTQLLRHWHRAVERSLRWEED